MTAGLTGHIPYTASIAHCCDLCAPSLLDRTRPGAAPPTSRQPTVPRGEIATGVRHSLVSWRTEVWQRDFDHSMVAPAGLLSDELVDALSAVGPIKTRKIFDDLLRDQWVWFTDYGVELFTYLGTLNIPPRVPISRKKKATSDSQTAPIPLPAPVGTPIPSDGRTPGITGAPRGQKRAAASALDEEAMGGGKRQRVQYTRSEPTPTTSRTISSRASLLEPLLPHTPDRSSGSTSAASTTGQMHTPGPRLGYPQMPPGYAYLAPPSHLPQFYYNPSSIPSTPAPYSTPAATPNPFPFATWPPTPSPPGPYFYPPPPRQ